MLQVIEIEQISIVEMLDFFRVKVDGMSGIPASNYRKAVACLRNFINEQPASSDIATTGFLENWFVFMFFRGLTAKTSLHYFDLVAGLYGAAVKEGKAAPYGFGKEAKLSLSVAFSKDRKRKSWKIRSMKAMSFTASSYGVTTTT